MKKKITLELDNKYKNINDAMPEVIAYLAHQRYECNIKSMGTYPVVEVDNIEYRTKIGQRIMGPLPPQTIILEENITY